MQILITLLIQMLEKKALQKVVLSALAKKSVVFAKVLKTAKTLAEIKKEIHKVMRYIDPNFLVKTLLQLPKNEVYKFLNDAVKANLIKWSQKNEILKSIQNNLSDMKKDAVSAMREAREQGKDLRNTKNSFKEAWKTYQQGGDETGWVNLSSSWIQRGIYNANTKEGNNGSMTIFIRSDNDKQKRIHGPYIYPNIPLEVWTAMKKATGKNGTGAGSVFWRMYLRKWLGSFLRESTYKKLEKHYTLDSRRYQRLPNQDQISSLIREQQELIRNFNNGFYRSKAAKQAPWRSPIDSAEYMKQRKIDFTRQKQQAMDPIKTMEAKLSIQKDRVNHLNQRYQTAVSQNISNINNLKNDLTNLKASTNKLRNSKNTLNNIYTTKNKVKRALGGTIENDINKFVRKSTKKTLKNIKKGL